MAFVAPITMFDHIQYANRTVLSTQKKRRLQHVTPITASTFYEQEEYLWESYVKRQWPQLPNNQHLKKAKQPAKNVVVNENAKSKITGKGMHINECI